MDGSSLVDFAPIVRLAGLALVVALLPLAWVWLRRRDADRAGRLAALTALTLFLTFDLIVFGAFTRLTDSGLGCPDWPGCYGEASPWGARREIHAAETAMPSGPVTVSKAWIEMIHRYLAATVGVLILTMTAVAWREHLQSRSQSGTRAGARALPYSPWWPTATLFWVVLQGLFGMYTVTLKLYPAVVTLHLLGGIFLLVLLALQHEAFAARPIRLPLALRWAVLAAAAVLAGQIALGGWVSTNYAVLACSDFPRCNGQWWPEGLDFANGFTILRHLGRTADGSLLGFDALVAIHLVHRVVAIVAGAALIATSVLLWRQRQPSVSRFALGIAVLTVLQVATGLSNVVLGWPIVAALMHTGGAAALMLLLTLLWARAADGKRLASRH
jgi:cytochrome c oxidase assembly protein subunit 15